MANTFKWSFPALDVTNSINGYSNVVQAVHWVYEGSNGTVYEQIVGCTPLPLPSSSLVDYQNLTPEIVTGWVVNALGRSKVAEMEVELANRIAAKVSPKVVSEPPPWAG